MTTNFNQGRSSNDPAEQARINELEPENIDSASEASEDVEDEQDEGWEDWVEDSADGQDSAPPEKTQCLFSEDWKASAEEALDHDKKSAGVDVVGVVAKLGLDFHQIIRLVNYIRKTNPAPEAVSSLTGSESFLGDDTFLTPVIPDDPLLQLDIEELALSYVPSSSTSHPSVANASAVASLQQTIESLRSELESSQSALLNQKVAMERFYQEKFGAGPSGSDKIGADSSVAKEVKGKKRDDDTGYFSGYSENEIHELMLKDKVRTESYRSFILNNPSIFKNAVVLDVGCGTGILSMFAAQAGAKKVYAVDASDVLYRAQRNIKENGFGEVVECLKGKIEELGDRIPKNGVDVIISEWMGYFLVYEAMLDSVVIARDQYLRPGGLMVPNQCSILLAAVQDDSLIQDSFDFWDDVYGFKMTAMKENIHKIADILVLKPETLISTVAGIKDVNMAKDTPKDSEFTSKFSLRVTRTGLMHGFLGWFDTYFTTTSTPLPALTLQDSPSSIKSPEVAFTTGPQGTPTHWKQTFFMLEKSLSVEEGDTVQGTFVCRKSVENSRYLEIEVLFRKTGDSSDRIQVWTLT